MKNIKRSIIVTQNNKRKKFYLKKKSFWSLGKSRQNFRIFDDDGYEIYDSLLLDILFERWIVNNLKYNSLEVNAEIHQSDYDLYINDSINKSVELSVHIDEENTTFGLAEPNEPAFLVESIEEDYMYNIQANYDTENVSRYSSDDYVSDDDEPNVE